MELYQIKTDYFVCGILVKDGVVKYTAPILRWARDKQLTAITSWVKEKGGEIYRVDDINYV